MFSIANLDQVSAMFEVWEGIVSQADDMVCRCQGPTLLLHELVFLRDERRLVTAEVARSSPASLLRFFVLSQI